MNHDHTQHDHPIEPSDALISRIVDGDADMDTWDALARCARTRPTVWRELGEAQRDHAALLQTMSRAGTLADTVAAPLGLAGRGSSAEHHRMAGGTSGRAGTHAAGGWPDRLRAAWWNWSGWAVAALVAVVWIVGFTERGAPGPADEARASLVPINSSQDAFDQYMQRGKAEGNILSEQPRRLLVNTRPDPNGNGIEVIFIQQVVERAVVPDLYQFRGADEQGRPSLVRVERRLGGRM